MVLFLVPWAWLLELLILFLGALLNAVISSFSLKSRRSLLASVVLPTRSECLGVGFASAVFESDNVPFAIHSKFHGIVFHCLMVRDAVLAEVAGVSLHPSIRSLFSFSLSEQNAGTLQAC